MTIILPFFDLFGYDVLLRNHITTLRCYDALGYDMVTVEAVQPGNEPLVSYNSPNHRHIVVTAPDKLLLQFNLFNIGIKQTSDPCLLLCDSGILLTDDMLRRAEVALSDGTDILQGFRYLDYLHADGAIARVAEGAYCRSIVSGAHAAAPPGGVIGISRDYYDRLGGLFDRFPFCGADNIWYHTSFGYTFPYRLSYRDTEHYKDTAPPTVPGFIRGSAKHLWHDRVITGAYEEVLRTLKSSGFLPEMLDYTDEGVLKWHDAYRPTYGKYITSVLSQRV